MNGAMVRVMIVDDEPRLCAAWSRLLQAQTDMTLVCALESADTFSEAIRQHAPRVVLMDLTMPGGDPLRAVAQAAAEHPETRVIIYSGFSDPETAQRAAEMGAWGLVDKLDPPQDIIRAIRRVAAGEMCYRYPISSRVVR